MVEKYIAEQDSSSNETHCYKFNQEFSRPSVFFMSHFPLKFGPRHGIAAFRTPLVEVEELTNI